VAEPRIRHNADEAKQLILDAAEKRFREGGVSAVRVQLVARDLGQTDAAIHHHFGSRKGLLTALLRLPK
jgi:AcrR family transcriptional regulator